MTFDVAIVGAGASGTLTAVQYARAGAGRGALIEAGARAARGLASTTAPLPRATSCWPSAICRPTIRFRSTRLQRSTCAIRGRAARRWVSIPTRRCCSSAAG